MKQSNAARGWHRFLFFVMMFGILGMVLTLPLANPAIGIYGFLMFIGSFAIFAIDIFWRSINL